MTSEAVEPIVVPILYKKLLIENIGSETVIGDLEKCFNSVLKLCGPKGKTRPEIQLAVDKKGRSQGYATIVVPVSKVDQFLNFDGWYVNKHQMKVSLADSHDVHMKWESTKKGVFMTSTTINSSRSTRKQTISPPYRLIDGGVYLTSPKFKAPDEVIKAAVSCGVEKLVCLGTSVYHSQEALKLCRLFSGTVFCTAGVNPRNAEYWTDESERQLEEVASCRECVAIGVCGFDLSTDAMMATAAQQMEAFEKQLQLACRLGKPVVVTDDKASLEVLSTLARYKDQLTRVAILLRPTDQDTFKLYLEQGFYIFISAEPWTRPYKPAVRNWLKSPDCKDHLDHLLLGSETPDCVNDFATQSESGEHPDYYHRETKNCTLSSLKLIRKTRKRTPLLLPSLVEVVSSCVNMDAMSVCDLLSTTTLGFYGFTQDCENNQKTVEKRHTPEALQDNHAKNVTVIGCVGILSLLVLVLASIFYDR